LRPDPFRAAPLDPEPPLDVVVDELETPLLSVADVPAFPPVGEVVATLPPPPPPPPPYS
jgi:hypothetical protein